MLDASRCSSVPRALALAVALCACTNDDDDGNAAGDRLDPGAVAKYAQPLAIPAVMPPISTQGDTTVYRIEARQFEQQVLPPPLPPTTVWGYGRAGDPLPGQSAESTFAYPARTIEARTDQPIEVTWVNGLVDDQGRYLPHLLPIDSTIHWADPGHEGHDGGHDDAASASTPYTGPVPIVTHVHGAHSFDHSDGYPEAWFLPDAVDIPEGFSRRGPAYASQGDAGEGAAIYEYPLDERAATLWYHDHTLGMTRVNIYAGLAGFWLIRDETEDALGLPGPAPRLGDPSGTRYYEIPLVIQDRTFARDGSLWYPSSRTEFGDTEGPYVPDSEIPPIWNPEFFGDVMVVNGRAWPFLDVEPRLYRFRVLNASDARTLMLYFDRAGLEFVQVGTDGGLAAEVVPQTEMLMGPAERVDILVDFSELAVGDVVTLLNGGPDEAWGGPAASPPQDPADPETTGQVMQFRVVEPTGEGTAGAIPDALPEIPVPQTTLPPRDLVLFEQTVPDDVPVHVLLGTLEEGPLPWSAPITEVMQLGDTEIWRIANQTGDAHPIHIHLVQFTILDRIPYDADAFTAAQQAWLDGTGPMPVLDDFVTGPPRPPLPHERGEKDTVMALPGTITRIVSTFDRAGRYVWHCHIIEHEDNDMMRPFVVEP